jgi:hypothetical protein
MKTFIIATMLTAGVLLQPQAAPMEHNGQPSATTTVATTVGENQTNARTIETTELASIRGGEAAACYTWYDENLDKHGMCCLNLWLFKVCLDVNESEIDRFLSSIF